MVLDFLQHCKVKGTSGPENMAVVDIPVTPPLQLQGPGGQDKDDTDTLIFVDADGVINVGVRDCPDQAPFLLCDVSVEKARLRAARAMQLNPQHPERNIASEAIEAVADRSLLAQHGEKGTYFEFATSPSDGDISRELVWRLAEIIRLAKNQGNPSRCQVVLSSSWRKPAHVERRVRLEQKLGEALGGETGRRSFAFDAITRLGKDDPADRMKQIGDFVEQFARRRENEARAQGRSPGGLRVLVFDDFTASPVEKWWIPEGGAPGGPLAFLGLPMGDVGGAQGTYVNSIEDAEAYLIARSERASPNAVCLAKLVHTFEEFKTTFGEVVRVGTGLTKARVGEAVEFLLGDGMKERPRAAPCSVDLERVPTPTQGFARKVRKTGSSLLGG